MESGTQRLRRYLLPHDGAVGEILSRLADVRWHRRRRRAGTVVFLDTVDRRLGTAGWLFSRQGDTVVLESTQDERVVEGDVDHIVTELIGDRALFVLAAYRTRVTDFQADGLGTLYRALYRPGLFRAARLLSIDLIIEGRSTTLESIRALLPNARDPIDEALAIKPSLTGIPVNHRSVKAVPGSPFETSARRVLITLTDFMRVHEPGIIGDQGPDFLHDYRVALRKKRSFLSVAKKYLDVDSLTDHIGFLRDIGRRCAPLRDADVHLMQVGSLGGQLEERIRSERDQLLADFRAFLLSPEYDTRMANWIARIESGSLASTDLSSHDAAQAILTRCADRVVQRGTVLRPDDPATRYHRLRIDCKKLRYGMEIFADLFPTPTFNKTIHALKSLQDVLGAIQDLTVQRAWLEEQSQSSSNVRDAAGRLATDLARRELRERRRFARAFRRFAGLERTHGFLAG